MTKKVVRASRVKLGEHYLRLDVPRTIGIVNVTSDSFSGDGLGCDVRAAVRMGVDLFDQGADIVDIGGESTRPGASPVTAEEEISRVCPVVKRLSKQYPGRISVDTMKSDVAEEAIAAGASIVNDVSGLRERSMIDVISRNSASVIIMHMKGEPRTMQKNPHYDDVVGEIGRYLQGQVTKAEKAGVDPDRILVDPGIGFGKTLDHNLEILGRLGELLTVGKPIVVGASRKSFIGKLTGAEPGRRLEGSIAAAVLAVREGASFVRVHDVAETVEALKVADAIMKSVKNRCYRSRLS